MTLFDHKLIDRSLNLYTMSDMPNTKDKLVDAAIEFLNSDRKRLSVKEIIKRADVGLSLIHI